jgi:hypothetical protein
MPLDLLLRSRQLTITLPIFAFSASHSALKVCGVLKQKLFK